MLRLDKKKRVLTSALLLIAPLFIIRSFTVLFPLFETFRTSFWDIRLLRGIREFAGLSNYTALASDPKIAASVGFTVIFVVSSMIGHIVLGIALALVLNWNFGGRRMLRTIVLIPWAMPTVVIGIAAKWAFNNEYGLINDLIRRFIPDFTYAWLVNTGSARLAVILTDLWKDLPFFAILVLASLQFIPSDIYEAAKIDGTSKIQDFFCITLPLIAKSIITLCIPFTMWRITSFDLVYAMTSGGPAEDTSLIAYRITTEAFTNLNTGYASALAVCLFIVMAALSLTELRILRRLSY